ncbi:MAG: asparaginase [Oceanospirillales bacterium]|uniref:Asparaginase n=1 Tax=Marinobacterium halophilum TaxID=267374 RepID=A0A2P8EY74_9GAMM|nr:asparaginase domain-containing protein [Marinobacterium halophilum]MBR9828435.1 asparaginase [Oceanospirillales bacterium]PSL14418.1 asparaginase [Marinobacterium halophilum]
MQIKILAAGGTFDKVYYDALSEYSIGEPMADELMQMAGVSCTYSVHSVLRKDSLDMTDADRQTLYAAITEDDCRHIVITHGTDTLVQTAMALQDLSERTIVLTGAMQPARFRDSDAAFNLGGAVALAQALPAGIYIFMNGRVFHPERVVKNRAAGIFEEHP